MAVTSRLDICNQAVALIKAKRIQSIDESSLEARECRRFYPKVLALALEGPAGSGHTFSFANRRVALAQLATNDREHEWLYAYAVPADMKNAIRIIPDFEAAGIGIPVPVPGQPYAETWLATGAFDVPYLIENGTIYTNAEAATLEYGINDIAEANIPTMVEEAMVVDLASRLVIPVKGDRKLRRELLEEADLLWQRAIADDKNRHPERQGEYISEAMAARGGYVTHPA